MKFFQIHQITCLNCYTFHPLTLSVTIFLLTFRTYEYNFFNGREKTQIPSANWNLVIYIVQKVFNLNLHLILSKHHFLYCISCNTKVIHKSIEHQANHYLKSSLKIDIPVYIFTETEIIEPSSLDLPEPLHVGSEVCRVHYLSSTYT